MIHPYFLTCSEREWRILTAVTELGLLVISVLLAFVVSLRCEKRRDK